jgi:DNA repair exonuclease SbcCD nuclease subunit
MPDYRSDPRRTQIIEEPARTTLRLVHTSDLHLEEAGDRRCRGLGFVVDLALELKADALLIAGDFFDSNRIKDEVVSFAVGQLARFGGDVIVVAGNHDCVIAESVYHRREIWERAPNAHVFRTGGGETVVLEDLGLTVWGKSLATYGDGEGALVGIPPIRAGDEHWQVAVGHGYFQPSDGRTWASFPMTAEQIAASGRHYIALGDDHAFRCVADDPVIAYYSGAPSSGTHTVAVIDLDGETGEVTVAKHSLRERY